jgi:hypothetical protein
MSQPGSLLVLVLAAVLFPALIIKRMTQPRMYLALRDGQRVWLSEFFVPPRRPSSERNARAYREKDWQLAEINEWLDGASHENAPGDQQRHRCRPGTNAGDRPRTGGSLLAGAVSAAQRAPGLSTSRAASLSGAG